MKTRINRIAPVALAATLALGLAACEVEDTPDTTVIEDDDADGLDDGGDTTIEEGDEGDEGDVTVEGDGATEEATTDTEG